MRAPLGREVRRRRFLTRADHARVALAKSDQGLLCGAPRLYPLGLSLPPPPRGGCERGADQAQGSASLVPRS